MVGIKFQRKHTNSGKRPLPQEYFLKPDVVGVAKDLLGKVLVTKLGGLTAGIITETEAYAGPEDKASHAYGNRRTARTEVLFQSGGRAYVYLCYGIHHLVNIVTGPAGLPHGVLIRAIWPIAGQELMQQRRRQSALPQLVQGPGRVAQALGLTCEQSGVVLGGSRLWIEEGPCVEDKKIISSARVGIDYAQEWRDLPWRFQLLFD
jgi:DNA-3-methyladenine glycosylase